ncbi:MAG TPA: SRPBCC family protein [Allosphingosinicella sp.]|jgi:uncharacterized protein YndB with AHSA1/START domain
MTKTAANQGFGTMPAPNTLRIERILPGPIERVWSYLTDGELRRRWFAAGEMPMEVGAPVELVWRNDELTDPPGLRPEGASGESRMQSRVSELDPPRKLAITWGDSGSVSFELETLGSDVRLTLVHSGVPDRARLLSFGPGWHTHLDILAALLSGTRPRPFWDEVRRLRDEYDRRIPA